MESTTKYLPAEERRAMTVQAVLALAESQHPGEITTAAIARQMHLTQGALFRHFATKADLWQTVMAWVRERLLARIEQASRENGSPLATLEAMFTGHVDFVVEYPGVRMGPNSQNSATRARPAGKWPPPSRPGPPRSSFSAPCRG